MILLHRSAKRVLSTQTGVVEISLRSFLHCYLLPEEPVPKNNIEQRAKSFSVAVEDQVHETSLKNQQQDVCWDLPLSQQQRLGTGVTGERRCEVDCLDGSSLQPAGGVGILKPVTHAGEGVHTLVDDSACTSAFQKEDERMANFVTCEAKPAMQVNHKEGNWCNEDDKGNISHKNNMKIDQIGRIASDFLSKRREENEHFVCSESEPATFDSCKACCNDTNKDKEFDSSIERHASETAPTTKFLTKGVQSHIVDGGTFVCDINRMSQNYNANLNRKEMCKVSLDSTETGVQREDKTMPRVKHLSEICEQDVKTSFSNKSEEGLRSNLSLDSTKTDVQNEDKTVPRVKTLSEICEQDVKTSYSNKSEEGLHSEFFGSLKGSYDSEKVGPFSKEQVQVSQPALSKVVKLKIKKRKKKHTNRQFGSKDLKHLSFTEYPSSIATSGQGLCEEEPTTHVTGLSEVQSKSIPAVACQEPSELLCSNDFTSKEALEMKDKERRESSESLLGEKREVNQRTRGSSVEDKHKVVCENSSKLLLHQDQTSGNFSQHMKLTQQLKEVDGEVSKNPTSMVRSYVYKENEGSDYLLGKKGRTIDDKESKVHYPLLRNHADLYIILDLNGVLIKRWDKNPSIPGVRKLNRNWIQLRPGCIEFLHKAFSYFRVGIWSTMTQSNVLNTCHLLEQQAHESLPFFMLWSKDSCYQHGDLRRPNKAKVVADFKPLSHVWGYFKPYLGFHNTVLVDDSPYKACMNNPYNCIFPDAFEGQEGDTYLNDVLWPYLENIRRSYNIQAYIADNPLGQRPVVAGHELYHHVQQVMDAFDNRAGLLQIA